MKSKLIRKFLALICLFLTNCGDSNSPIDWSDLKNSYSSNNDQKSEAVNFLQNNMDGMTSEVIKMRHPSKQTDVIDLNKIMHTSKCRGTYATLLKKGYKPFIVTVKDVDLITTNDLRNNIDEVYLFSKSCFYSAELSQDILLRYLLPNKIYNEAPSNWKKILRDAHQSEYYKWLQKSRDLYRVDKKAFIDSLVNEFLIPQTKRWYEYTATKSIGNVPSFCEIFYTKGGDCYYEAAIQVYMLRAFGVPASFDVIPFWGNSNGSHATCVYWNEGEKRMRLPVGFIHKPAKIFRRTFERNSVCDSLDELGIENDQFKLDFLKTDHLMDVTSEHVLTKNLEFEIPQKLSAKLGYITVLSYGNWVPIYWSSLKKQKLLFRNMGTGILYRVEVPLKDNKYIYSKPFILNDNGKLQFPMFSNERIDINVHSINQGKESSIKKNNIYLLWYMNSSGAWKLVGEKFSKYDKNIFFKNVPKSLLYRLDNVSARKFLSRPFKFVGGKQIWY